MSQTWLCGAINFTFKHRPSKKKRATYSPTLNKRSRSSTVKI